MSNTDDIMPQAPTMESVLVVLRLAIQMLDWSAMAAATVGEPTLCRELNVRAASLRYLRAEHEGYEVPSPEGDFGGSPRSEPLVKGEEPVSKSGEGKC